MLIQRLFQKKSEPKHVFCLHDIYFIVNFDTESIIPIIFNTNYTAIQRLDTMEVLANTSEKDEHDDYIYSPQFLIEAEGKYSTLETFYHNNKYYSLNPIAIRMLFAKDADNMQFLSDIQILSAEQLDLKYNLVRKYKSMREHVKSPNVAYIDDIELSSMINFITTSKTFKSEIESYKNKLKNDFARKF